MSQKGRVLLKLNNMKTVNRRNCCIKIRKNNTFHNLKITSKFN